jgi:hypothetical protein
VVLGNASTADGADVLTRATTRSRSCASTRRGRSPESTPIETGRRDDA